MRKTKNEIMKLQEAGFYRDVEIGDPDKAISEINKAKDKETGFSDLNDDRFTLYESHVDLYLKGDPLCEDEAEIALPYVVTMIRGTNTVLSVRRNWRTCRCCQCDSQRVRAEIERLFSEVLAKRLEFCERGHCHNLQEQELKRSFITIHFP